MITQRLDKALASNYPTHYNAELKNSEGRNNLKGYPINSHISSIASNKPSTMNYKGVGKLFPSQKPAVHFAFENLSHTSVPDMNYLKSTSGNREESKATPQNFLNDLKNVLRKRSNGDAKNTDSPGSELKPQQNTISAFCDNIIEVEPNEGDIDSSPHNKFNPTNSCRPHNIASKKNSPSHKDVGKLSPSQRQAVLFGYQNLSCTSVPNINNFNSTNGNREENKASNPQHFLDELKNCIRKQSNTSNDEKDTDSHESEPQQSTFNALSDKIIVIESNEDSIDSLLDTKYNEYAPMAAFTIKDRDNCSDNLPDDLKAKLSVVDSEKELYLPMFNRNLNVTKSKSTSDFYSYVESKSPSKGLLTAMSSCPINCNIQNSNIKHCSKASIESCHMRGDVKAGCIHAPSENKYIYDFNPDSSHVNNVFIKTNEKIYPLPCFCDKKKSNDDSYVEVYYSCENLCNTSDNISKNENRSPDQYSDEHFVLHRFDNQNETANVSASIEKNSQPIVIKKFRQLKQLLTDW